MPKTDIDYPEKLSLRVSEKTKEDLLKINPNYAYPVREALTVFLPIKKLLLNPLAIPRIINSKKATIEFQSSEEGDFILKVGGKKLQLSQSDLNVLLANVFLFTQNQEVI